MEFEEVKMAAGGGKIIFRKLKNIDKNTRELLKEKFNQLENKTE